MKKIIIIAGILAMMVACSKDEAVKEVEVIKEVEVPVEVIKKVNVLDDTEAYIATLEKGSNGISHNGVPDFLKTQIKKCLDTPAGSNYDFWNIYVGQHEANKNDDGTAGYGSEGTIIIVFFSKNTSQELRVYQAYSNYYRFHDILNYDKFIESNFHFSDDFFKNEFIGSMSRADFLKL